jgi:hypothetical protein
MLAEVVYYSNGMTVKELKRLVANLPETNEYGDYTVWVETELGLSSIVKSIWPLNKREEGCDILFSSQE